MFLVNQAIVRTFSYLLNILENSKVLQFLFLYTLQDHATRLFYSNLHYHLYFKEYFRYLWQNKVN